MPEKSDYWWIITPDSDRTDIRLEAGAAVERFALPYLERVSTIEGLAEHGGCTPLIGKSPSLVVASALAVLGRQHEAMAMFEAYTANRSTLSEYELAWLQKYGKQA